MQSKKEKILFEIEDKIEDLYEVEIDEFRKQVLEEVLLSLNQLKIEIHNGNEKQQIQKWQTALQLVKYLYPDFNLENKIKSIIEIFTQS